MDFFSLFVIAAGLSMDAFAVSICEGLSLNKWKLKKSIEAGLWFGIFQALMPTLGYLLGKTFADKIENVDHWIAFILLLIIGGNMIREAIAENKGEAAKQKNADKNSNVTKTISADSKNADKYSNVAKSISANSKNTDKNSNVTKTISADSKNTTLNPNNSDGIQQKNNAGFKQLIKMLMLAIATSIDAFAVGLAFAILNVNIVAAALFIGLTTFGFSFVGVYIGKKVGDKFEKHAQIVGGTVLILIGLKILLEHLGVINF